MNMRRKINNKAQAFLEYGAIIIILVVVFVAMRVFLGRSIQEKYRQAGDVYGRGEQYEPGETSDAQSAAGTWHKPETPVEPVGCDSVKKRVEELDKDIQDLTKLKEDFNQKIMRLRTVIQQLQQIANLGYRPAEQEAKRIDKLIQELQTATKEIDKLIKAKEEEKQRYESASGCF